MSDTTELLQGTLDLLILKAVSLRPLHGYGVLNSYCQTHDIPNLYVFGGNAFPSTGDKHPTLTMMALTARGCDHVIAGTK